MNTVLKVRGREFEEEVDWEAIISGMKTMNEIHDKTGEKNWSSEVENWESEFNSGDVVIGPGYGSFKTMFVVHEINLDAFDYVTHRGVFWDETEARVYADTLV